MSKAQKLVLIGIDSMMPGLLNRFLAAGRLPNLERLITRGAYTKAIPQMPSLTPTNWTTIATGATPGAHGITCFQAFTPGDPLNKNTNGFLSSSRQAEALWEVADRLGKTSIIIEYPCSWPRTTENLLHLGWVGFPGEMQSIYSVSADSCYVTYDYEERRVPWDDAGPIEFRQAEGWRNVGASGRTPLESAIAVKTRDGRAVDFQVLMVDRGGDGYDTLLVSHNKDAAQAMAILNPEQISNWLRITVPFKGEQVDVAFRIVLTELSRDGEKVKIFVTQMYRTQGFSYPHSLAGELVERFGPYLEHADIKVPVTHKWCSVQNYIALAEEQEKWLANSASYLLTHKQWDLFFMKWHFLDHLTHAFLGKIDPASPLYDPGEADYYWEIFAKGYGFVDDMVGQIASSTDDNALVVVVSDHGHIVLSGAVAIDRVLAKAGLLKLHSGSLSVDWSATRAYAQRLQYVYVNLKGRDPDGIVEPGQEYEQVRDDIITALLNLRDPRTGKQVVLMAARREEAATLGLSGDRVGDVIYVLDRGYRAENSFEHGFGPDFLDPDMLIFPYEDVAGLVMSTWGISQSNHGQYFPSCRFSVGEIESLLVMAGPGVKAGYQSAKSIHLRDVAPTLAHILNLPTPAQSEGRVLSEMLL